MAETTKKTKIDKYTYAKGRRKTSNATVRLFEGKGESLINGKPLEEVFPSKTDKAIIHAPLTELGKMKDFYFTARTAGGGKSGQRGAIVHALARALVEYEPEYRVELKPKGYLMRDPRMVERKHTGFRKARKSEQYSKR